MNFHLTDLNKLFACTKSYNLNYLNVIIQQNKFKITINRKIIQYQKDNIQTVNSVKKTQYLNKKRLLKTSKNLLSKTKKHTSNLTAEYFTIVSPMVGTFYRTPAPSEPCFIELNDTVHVNQTVCIIEAMKLMNEIKAEVQGVIIEIFVKDGDIVDCGQALMRIKAHKL